MCVQKFIHTLLVSLNLLYSAITPLHYSGYSTKNLGWSGGVMVLGNLPMPGRPTNLDYSRERAYCACSGCGRGWLDITSLVYHFSFLFLCLWETARCRLKYCLKGPLNNQPTKSTKNSRMVFVKQITFQNTEFYMFD